MRVMVVGGGAVGSLLAWALAAGGADVTILRRRPAGRAAGSLTVVDPAGVRHAPQPVAFVAAATDLEAPPELVLLAVKLPDLPAALAALPVWPSTALLSVENGVGAEALVAAARPAAPRIAGSLTASVVLDADGTIRWLRRGGLALAPVAGPVAPLLDGLVTSFAAAGLAARRLPEAAAMKWSKLVANLVANATSALLDEPPATVYGDARLFALEQAQLREALSVMRRLGLRPVALPGANVPLLALAAALPAALGRPLLRRVVAGARGGKSPSLRLHLAAGGGPSEAPWLNGAVAREAARLGVPAPVNAALERLVEEAAADAARRAWFRGHPERLLAAVGAAGL